MPGLGGSISSVPKVDRNVYAVFAEVNIPIVKNLEANVALRYDDYEDVGNTTNPKISLRWQPKRQTPAARRVAAPASARRALPELYTPNFLGATGGNYDDPLRCPSTGSPRDCNTQFTTQLGGNREPQAGAVDELDRWRRLGAGHLGSRSVPTTGTSRSTT